MYAFLFCWGLLMSVSTFARVIKLNTSNILLIRGEINEKSASDFIYNLNSHDYKRGVFVYLNTPGGSVKEGMKIVHEIQKYNLSCIADTAYSMGFIIFQSCATRYILPHSSLMQHQMAFAVRDQKYRIQNYIDYVDSMENDIIKLQSDRINITADEFVSRINNDWWIYGIHAITHNCADEMVNVECTTKLTKDNYTVESGSYLYTYSKCPLVSNYIAKEKTDSDEFFFTFF